MQENIQLTNHILSCLDEQFSQATSNVSKVARTWSFTITMPAFAWLFTEIDKGKTLLIICIIAISLLCLMVDCLQYFYTAASYKALYNKIDLNILSPENVGVATKRIQTVTYTMTVFKFISLFISTLLLLIFLFTISL